MGGNQSRTPGTPPWSTEEEVESVTLAALAENTQLRAEIAALRDRLTRELTFAAERGVLYERLPTLLSLCKKAP